MSEKPGNVLMLVTAYLEICWVDLLTKPAGAEPHVAHIVENGRNLQVTSASTSTSGRMCHRTSRHEHQPDPRPGKEET